MLQVYHVCLKNICVDMCRTPQTHLPKSKVHHLLRKMHWHSPAKRMALLSLAIDFSLRGSQSSTEFPFDESEFTDWCGQGQ